MKVDSANLGESVVYSLYKSDDPNGPTPQRQSIEGRKRKRNSGENGF